VRSLLYGPYEWRGALVGGRAHCHYRQCGVTVVGTTGTAIDWPIGQVDDCVGGAGRGPVIAGDMIVAMVLESAPDLAAALGVHVGTVRLWRQSLGIRGCPRGARQRHSDAGRARAASGQLALARGSRESDGRPARMAADHARGVPVAEIAKRYGVSRGSVYAAIRQYRKGT
jgi:transposase-like protein